MTYKPVNIDKPLNISKAEIKERLPVCEKVKAVLEMDRRDYYTTSQLANFFDIAIETVNKYFERYKETFLLDGVYEVQAPDYVLSSAIANDEGVVIPNSDILPENIHKESKSVYDYRIYPRRGILRMAMLLRSSTVAKAIREQLLSLVELDELDFVRSDNIKREIYLLKGIYNAIDSDTQDLIQKANEDYKQWRDRYIYTVQPYFQQEKAIAKLYEKFNITTNKVKWRVTNQYVPSQRHKQLRTHNEALTAAVQKMAKEFYNRDELSKEEIEIIESKNNKDFNGKANKM